MELLIQQVQLRRGWWHSRTKYLQQGPRRLQSPAPLFPSQLRVHYAMPPAMVLRTFALLLVLVTMRPAPAADHAQRHFRLRPLNTESQFPACAIFDVNRDGRVDVFSGGWWYEAPTWKRHFVREVQQIGGRFDDYSNLTMDVNGDGWIDVISVNYRSRSIYWVENPGDSRGAWKAHEIDRPGPSETGRLEDIDGDGNWDLLPNGVQFAAWYELVRGANSDSEGAATWRRYDLPQEAMGHGLGFGDIDGDGRGDLVTPRGWLQAPKDPRNERWVFHAEFKLHRDASVPILVHDVDDDGDADLIWGRGHNIGLYWMEQGGNDQGRTWTKHVIDTSWSQAHALLLADLDNDGQQELVAGKRYLGHDGRDPGEWDPLAIYAYDFDRETRTWRRDIVDDSGLAGIDLDPKAADVDGDGDIDIIAPSRAGLYLCENTLIDKTPPAETNSDRQPHPSYDPRDLFYYLTDAGERREIKSPENWGRRRVAIHKSMEVVMGEFPNSSRRVPLDMRIESEEETPRYIRRKVTFAVEPGDRVPAWLLVPKNLKLPAAAVLCLHQTTPLGKDELAAIGGRDNRWFAHEVAERGFVCLVPDYPSFGEYEYDFRTKGAHYASGSMKAIWNNVRALDLLESLPEVDPDRIGCLGHSLGGHNSLFTAAFDQRIKAVVTSCGFTAFHHYYGGNLKGWTSDRYMPRIRDRYENNPDLVPFDFYEVLAAIAPRGIFVCAPLHDSNFENEGVKKVVGEVQKVYSLLSAPGGLVAKYPDAGHDFPEAEREQAYAWLKETLK